MKSLQAILYSILLFCCTSCSVQPDTPTKNPSNPTINNTSIVLLGTIQDAGYPQIGCTKECCATAFKQPNKIREVISLGLIDKPNNNTYLFDATPDMVRQMKKITSYESEPRNEIVDAIFLTHAHIGHYTGLMYLGKEAIDAHKTPVHVMPRMKEFLTKNGPWSQLTARENILLKDMEHEKSITLSKDITVIPFKVPHRDEFSETVGFKIIGPNKTALFIPDIDKWDKWDKNIIEEIRKVDYAFLDATFYSGAEINNRDISQIPHPFVIESLEKFKDMDKQDRNKVIFIHFNHTNPLIDINSEESEKVIRAGYRIGSRHDIFEL